MKINEKIRDKVRYIIDQQFRIVIDEYIGEGIMSFDELKQCENNMPIKTLDGKFGLLIRWGDDCAGFQICGDGDIRWINLNNLARYGDVLIEKIEDI